MPRSTSLTDAGAALADVGHFLFAQGWSPATSSNYSVRIDPDTFAITASGRDKGTLTPEDVLAVDLHGAPRSLGTPSAETGLHAQLYRHDPAIGAVLHTHSRAATVLSRLAKHSVTLEEYELLKAFEGVATHETSLDLPIFENDQDIPRLATQVERWLNETPHPRAYLIRGHGLYTWASTLAACRRHIEAVECLLQCALDERLLRAATHNA